MDDLKRTLQGIGGSLQELENIQRSMGRDLSETSRRLKSAEKKSDDMVTQLGELRDAFAGLAAIVEQLWGRYEDHEARISALERKAS